MTQPIAPSNAHTITRAVIAVLPHDRDTSLVREGLREEDVALEVVRSTEAAVQRLTSIQASVIIYDTDTGQPWRDAVRCLLAAQPMARVVLLSQSTDARTWWDLFDCGAYDLVTRPFQPANFRAIIRSALSPPRFLSSTA